MEKTIGKPTFGAGILLLLVLMLFGAATNTLSGWLYAISGLGLAFLILGSLLADWTLAPVRVTRSTPPLMGVGETAIVTVEVMTAIAPIQVQDLLPPVLGIQPVWAMDPPQHAHSYEVTPTQRGIHTWTGVRIRSAAPLGLIWRQRVLACPGQIMVYPRLWDVGRVNLLTRGDTTQPAQQVFIRNASEGSTRSVRPYRSGDPMRWVHWRTSARVGSLQIRELEQPQNGEGLTLVLDATPPWEASRFELALEAVASLLVYALRRGMPVRLITPTTTLTQREESLTYLAGINPEPMDFAGDLPGLVLWFSARPAPQGLWVGIDEPLAPIGLYSDEPLGPQLERVGVGPASTR